jgi:hypothetical protein
VQGQPVPPQAPDWSALLKLAGLDPAALQTAEPQWNWLAAADSRAAWTGTFPGSNAPLRVEAAAFGGRPVAFHVIGPWTKPWRTPEPSGGGETAFLAVLFVLLLAIVGGASVLARRNLREGRGDRRGAQALGSAMAAITWTLWLLNVHLAETAGMLAIFLLTIVTSVFYAALFWAMYLALEPFVRRHWPQTLVSWTTLLSGRVRDAIVGRDVLFGVLLGVLIAVLIRTSEAWKDDFIWMEPALLGGTRQAAAVLVAVAYYAIRTALFVFFLLFLFRVLLRNQWVAASVFVALFAAMNALASDRPIFDGVTTLVYWSFLSIAVLRWGLTTLTVGLFVANLLLNVPATSSLSAWYAPQAIVIAAIPIVLAAWAFYTSLGGRLWSRDLLA